MLGLQRSRLGGRTIAVVTVAVPAAGAIALLTLGGGGAGHGAKRPAAGATAAIERRDLVVHDSQGGTLGYPGSRTVFNRLSGTITWLPSAGSVIKRGGRLF